MKRKYGADDPVPEEKRIELAKEGISTRSWSRDLTGEELANLRLAKSMYDEKRNEHPFNHTNPFGKVKKFWFYCQEHGQHFESTNRQMILRGFKHTECTEFYLWMLFPDLEAWFMSSADGRKFHELTCGAHIDCTWKCNAGHVFHKTPKRLSNAKNPLLCHECNLAENSMKARYPEMEKYFIESASKRRFDQIPSDSHDRCLFWCRKMLHKIERRARQFVKGESCRCRECSLLKIIRPRIFDRLDPKANKEAGIDIENLTYGSHRIVHWRCQLDPKHKNWSSSVEKHTSCPACATYMSDIELGFKTVLEKHGVSFERQKKFVGLRHINPLHCDFYIPPGTILNRPTIIEVDGQQHFPNDNHFNAVGLTCDRKKNLFARTNEFNLLRVATSVQWNFKQIFEQFCAAAKNSTAPYHVFAGREYDQQYRQRAYDP